MSIIDQDHVLRSSFLCTLHFLYKKPAEEGTHKAKKIGEYNNCNNSNCWITSADISSNGEKVVLLSQDNILVFSNFKGDNFCASFGSRAS